MVTPIRHLTSNLYAVAKAFYESKAKNYPQYKPNFENSLNHKNLSDEHHLDIISEILEKNAQENSVKNLPEVPFHFSGMALTSAVAQPFITLAILLGTEKVAGNKYSDAVKKIFSTPFGSIFVQGLQTFKRRVISSMLPAASLKTIGDKFELSPEQIVAINTSFETVVSVLITSEAKERFNGANSAKFSIVDANQKGVDLTQIKNFESFKNLCANSRNTADFGQREWNELQKLQKYFKKNIFHQSSSLAARNGMFSSAVFMAKPWAKEIVEANEEEFSKFGLDKNSAIKATTYTIRAILAWSTAPLDRVFSQFSLGEKSGNEILQNLLKDTKSGNVNKFFAGAVARTVLCVLTASTIAEGIVLGENGYKVYKDFNNTLVEFFNNKNNQNPSTSTNAKETNSLLKNKISSKNSIGQ